MTLKLARSTQPTDSMRSLIPRVVLGLFALSMPAAAAAQLRPVDPLDWRAFDTAAPLSFALGFGMLHDQHASLAGTRGTLYELGNFQLAWRTGRVVLELAGTAHRRFEDQVVVREPALGANPPNGELRRDAGDVRASTAIQLLGEGAPAAVALRFGTRLPTTSEEPGLDRDRTDFFATVGGRFRRRSLSLTAESGIAINGTRLDGYDQADVLTYAVGLEYDIGSITPYALLVGHDDVHSWAVRGNEDLSEVRLGLRAGGTVWIQAAAVKGITTFSPGGGFLLMAGLRP